MLNNIDSIVGAIDVFKALLFYFLVKKTSRVNKFEHKINFEIIIILN